MQGGVGLCFIPDRVGVADYPEVTDVRSRWFIVTYLRQLERAPFSPGPAKLSAKPTLRSKSEVLISGDTADPSG